MLMMGGDSRRDGGMGELQGVGVEKEWNNLEERDIIRKRISYRQPAVGDKV